jgi:1-acyl-sn-glycerol-3-phosphate acyltransferase
MAKKKNLIPDEIKMIIEEVKGIENFTAVSGGKIITSNHFHPCENYAVWRAIRPYMGKRRLYKVIREGNYTNPPKPYGFIMRNCNTLPLSSNVATMKKFMHAFKVLMKRGESVLIYPEQSMWLNYRKPRPMQDGAFSLAVLCRVPVVPFFLTMRDADTLDADGFPIQKYTVHILPAIYPDPHLPQKRAKEKMCEENYAAWVECYEDFYGISLDYGKDDR